MVYQPHGTMAVWGAEFAVALGANGSICGCEIHLRPGEVHRPNDVSSQSRRHPMRCRMDPAYSPWSTFCAISCLMRLIVFLVVISNSLLSSTMDSEMSIGLTWECSCVLTLRLHSSIMDCISGWYVWYVCSSVRMVVCSKGSRVGPH